MIYGIKRKGNKNEKKKQNYNYNSDSDKETQISNKIIENQIKNEALLSRKPINKNNSIGYSFIEIEVL